MTTQITYSPAVTAAGRRQARSEWIESQRAALADRADTESAARAERYRAAVSLAAAVVAFAVVLALRLGGL